MSEKRFTLEQWTKHSLYYSDGEYSAHMSIGFICEKVEKKLNEQDKEISEAERKLSEITNNLANEIKKNGLLNEEINQLRIENMRLKKKDGDGV